MSERDLDRENVKPGEQPSARQVWVRPTVTKLAAADAEVGTRPNVADGNFSVS